MSGKADQPSRLRAWRRIAMILFLLLVHLPLHGAWRLFGLRSPWPRSFLAGVGRAAGADIEIDGAPVLRDVLIVANHLSWLDILLLADATGVRFVAKDEVRTWPVIGWLAVLNRTVFVARTERGRVHEQAERLRDAIAEHDPVALFPEGGTGNGRELGPFRASLLTALLPPMPGVRLQPVAIDYGAEQTLIAWPDENSTGVEAMRLLGLPGRRQVTLHFLDLIDPAALPDRKALTAAAHAALAAALGETLGEAGPPRV